MREQIRVQTQRTTVQELQIICIYSCMHVHAAALDS